MRRTRLSLTSRASQFLHYVFKQLYDMSVQEKRARTRPHMQPVEMSELSSCFLHLLSAYWSAYLRTGASRHGQRGHLPPGKCQRARFASVTTFWSAQNN